jgi:RNA polymerase sigma factor (sigma-70 family)
MTHQDFRKIVEQYERLVFTVCRQLVANDEEAENLTQETFLSAYVNIDRCKDNNFKPWLCRIAANKAKDYLKSAYARRVGLMEENIEVASSQDLEEQFMVKERTEEIRRRILSLKEPYLLVSRLYFLEEKTISEIASQLKRPPKTVQTQLSRAKKILKKAIKEVL